METRGSEQFWSNRVNGAIRCRNDSRYDEADKEERSALEKLMDWLGSNILDDDGEPDDPADSFMDVFFFNTGMGKKVNDLISRIDRRWRSRINNKLARHGTAMAVLAGAGAAIVALITAASIAGDIVALTGGAVEPLSEGLTFSDHLIKQMIKREVVTDDVLNVINNGVKYFDDLCQNYSYFLPNGEKWWRVAVSLSNEIKTVIPNSCWPRPDRWWPLP